MLKTISTARVNAPFVNQETNYYVFVRWGTLKCIFKDINTLGDIFATKPAYYSIVLWRQFFETTLTACVNAPLSIKKEIIKCLGGEALLNEEKTSPFWRNDTWHNDTRQNDTLHNVAGHYVIFHNYPDTVDNGKEATVNRVLDGSTYPT
jgi:hypothetical protein